MSITSIALNGSQLCNFAWVKSGVLSAAEIETYLDINFSDTDTSSDDTTLMFAKFNNTLEAGSYLQGDDTILGWDIYKQKIGEAALKFVCTVDITSTSIVDHFIENGAEYIYYLFPKGTATLGEPIVSDTVSSKAWNWIIFTATETDMSNVLSVNATYVFQGNVETGDISNNATSSVMNNFTQYPKIIKGTQNYKSGKLTGLIGYTDMHNNAYVESEGLRDALYALVTTQDRIFLKNRSGDIWEVSIHSAISMRIGDRSNLQPNTATIEWTEIANTNDISLIGEV